MKEAFQKFNVDLNGAHMYQNELPILQSPLDCRTEAVKFSAADDFSVLYWKDYDYLSDFIKQRLTKAMREICLLSDTERRFYLENHFYTETLTPFNSDNSYLIGQQGLFTAKKIKAFSPVGPYAGRYLENEKWLEAEYSQYSQLASARYTHACDPAGFPCVAAFQTGNYVSMINDWRPENYLALTQTEFSEQKRERQNVASVIVQCGAARVPFFIAVKEIPSHHQLFTDYGQNYWEREALYEEWTMQYSADMAE